MAVSNVTGAIVELLTGRLKRVDIVGVVAGSTKKHSPDIIALQRAQLAAGTNADGSPIRPFYRPLTIQIKKRKGQPTDRVTLRDRGDFYNDLFTETTREGTTISSHDPKTASLVVRYGATIFGLSVASREQVIQRMRPTLQTDFRNALGL